MAELYIHYFFSRLSFLQSLLEPESLRQDWLELALTHDAPQRCDTLTPDGQPRSGLSSFYFIYLLFFLSFQLEASNQTSILPGWMWTMPAWVHFTTGFYFYHNKLNNKVKVKYIIVTMHSCDSCRWHSHCFSWGYGRLLSLLIGLPADLSSKQKMAETCRSHGYFTLCLTQQKVFLFAVDVR